MLVFLGCCFSIHRYITYIFNLLRVIYEYMGLEWEVLE